MKLRSYSSSWGHSRLPFTGIQESADKDILLLNIICWACPFFSAVSKWSFIRRLINTLSWLSGMRDTHFIFKHFYKSMTRLSCKWQGCKRGFLNWAPSSLFFAYLFLSPAETRKHRHPHTHPHTHTSTHTSPHTHTLQSKSWNSVITGPNIIADRAFNRQR